MSPQRYMTTPQRRDAHTRRYNRYVPPTRFSARWWLSSLIPSMRPPISGSSDPSPTVIAALLVALYILLAATCTHPTVDWCLPILLVTLTLAAHSSKYPSSTQYIEHAVLDILVVSLLLVEWLLFEGLEQGARYYSRHHANHVSSL
jgi:hypothetical protein